MAIPKHERTPCEVWTRVMGYHRPVSSFNLGKQSEHADRQCFKECDEATQHTVPPARRAESG